MDKKKIWYIVQGIMGIDNMANDHIIPLITFLKCIESIVADNNLDKETLRIVIRDIDYGNWHTFIALEAVRDETEDEEKDRLIQEQFYSENEYKTYLSLKKKYEPPTN